MEWTASSKEEKKQHKHDKVEKVLIAILQTFAELQRESEENLLKYKGSRAKQGREHKEHLLQILSGAQSPSQAPIYGLHLFTYATVRLINNHTSKLLWLL